ncbi:pentatricopeptide repeat-containing protein At3g29230-like [Macadamia integrifolia]|uniref:pentatricopeptide repeat-containing protein At3g29230-like n=1 Tax=Macadamia integrifolia TaxID=60698 RepID=UPI001C4E5C3A|nr:pentatricopeptide repeat-containing protein At3g29230-like [Macadamia integrifolia]
MAVSTVRLTSLSLEKILKTQQNLSKPFPSRIWKGLGPESHGFDDEGLSTLKLSHPILRFLDSCNSTIKEFNQIHAQLLVFGLFQHPLAAGRAIRKLCTSPSLVPHAVSIFSHLDEPDAFICNTILRTYVNLNDPDSAIGFYYRHMIGKCVSPSHYTFPLLSKISAELGSIRQGERAHSQILKFGLESDLFVRNSLIHMYSVCGKIEDARWLFDRCSDSDLVTWNSMIDGYVKNGYVGAARLLFDEMPERDIVSWNSMIAGYVGAEDMKAAEDIFERMPVSDVVSWNSMIDGYARTEDVFPARELFDQMPYRNIVSWNTVLALYVRIKDYNECLRLFDRMASGGETSPNEATLVSVLTACAGLGMLDRGKWVHSYIRKNGKIRPDVLLSTSLLTMYAKCGAMDSAREVFDEMPERSVVSWNSMIMGYGMHGQGEKALEIFLEMEKRGQTPNDATFVCVLSACTHAGMVLEGWWHFDLMHRVYKIEPKVEHYGCMVDLLGRAGLMKDSEVLIRKMPMKAGPALWGALLSACSTHSNLELGEILGKRLIELEPQDVGPYILLSNIYAAEGKWDEVEMVRKMIRERGLHKAAGCSLVDLGGADYESTVDDTSVHKKSMMYSMLTEMGTQMKLSCREYGETEKYKIL